MTINIHSLLSDPLPIRIDKDPKSSEYSEINAPTKIDIQGYETLYLARKKHYIPQREKPGYTSPYRVSKKSSISPTFNILNIDKKTQGRPFNDNLNARFLFFRNQESLISNLLNLKTNRSDNDLNSLSRNYECKFPCPPSPTTDNEGPSPLSRRSSTSPISSFSSTASLDSMSSVSTNSSFNSASRNPTISKLVNNYSINTSFIINYDNVLAQNFITSQEPNSAYDDSNIARNDPNDFVTQSIEFQNFNNSDSELDISAELCKIFNCEALSFVKIIRNNKGKLIKFEIISSANQDNNGRPFDINFIKKFITYPRYKSRMKIYLIKGKFERKLWFYNDIRMLIWDLENLDMKDKKVLINNSILNN